MDLAVYITGHGYGHLTRTCEVLRELRALSPGTRLHLRAPYAREKVVEALGFEPASHEALRLDLGLVQHDGLRADLAASARALEACFGPEGEAAVEQEARWLRRGGINAALIDISPRAFDACARAGVPAYGLGNFSWDWIWRDLAEEEPRLGPLADMAARAYAHCRLLFRTPMHKGLEAFPRTEDVPLVSRRSRRERDELRRLLGFEEGRPAVLLSFGGEGLRGARLPGGALARRLRFVVTEPMADPGEPHLYISDARLKTLGLRYCDLVRAADLVMSKPGYSIVAECIGNATAMVYTDRGRFAEYPVLEAGLRAFLPNAYLSSEDLYAGRWQGALEALLARRPLRFAPCRSDGAEVVARRLLELAAPPA